MRTAARADLRGLQWRLVQMTMLRGVEVPSFEKMLADLQVERQGLVFTLAACRHEWTATDASLGEAEVSSSDELLMDRRVEEQVSARTPDVDRSAWMTASMTLHRGL